MRALLLAAGLGTRLSPLTDSIPKCLVEINNKPLLDYWIELLVKAGITEILVNLHYLHEKVRSHLEKYGLGENITCVYEKELLGTGGTILKNKDFFENEPFMLIHADNLSRFDLHAFIQKFETREKGIEITMMTFNTANPEECGIVELDEKGIVVEFYEKVKNPPGNLANGAVYILSPSILEYLNRLGKEEIDFSTEVLPHYMRRINTFHNDVYHRDIGTLESLLAARREFPAIPF